MMKPLLLLLTNLGNSDPEEDLYLADKLGQHFKVVIRHPLQFAQSGEKIHLILIRNIWPTHEYQSEFDRLVMRLKKKRYVVYTPLSAKGDLYGKKYLVSLFRAKYPVPPTVFSKKGVKGLPVAAQYFAKPLASCDGVGSKTLSRVQAQRQKIKQYIIQPHIFFRKEICFYFIDNKFVYALWMKHRLKNKIAHIYKPTKKQILWAAQFVKWNDLPFGLQRIDAMETNDDQLLLSEIEDSAPFLYLLEINKNMRDLIIKKLVRSLKKVIAARSHNRHR